MNKVKLALIISIVCILFLGCKQENIIINETVFHQKIDGFGASGAWWAQDIGSWSESKRNEITEKLFDKEKGIGLSIYRYNIGAGSGENIEDNWRNTNSIETKAGVYDIDNDKEAIWVLRRALELGVDKVVAFANSPPARLTISGEVTGEEKGNSNLSKDNYEAFADYLIDIVLELRNNDIQVDYVSPINEPQWDWSEKKGQEGNHYTLDECLEVVQVLNNRIKERAVDIEISAIEAGEWKDAIDYADKILEDEDLFTSLDHFAGHSYWSKAKHKKSFIEDYNKKYSDMKLWVTEWTEMKSGRDVSIKTALTLANEIHDDMTILSASSWQYWIAVSKYDYRDGLIYTNENTEDIIDTKRLYALGNYSKFIKPGYKRISLNENNGIKVSAYTGDDKLVIVIINDKNKDISKVITTKNTYKNMQTYVTDEVHDLEQTYSGNSKNTVEILANSITTIILGN